MQTENFIENIYRELNDVENIEYKNLYEDFQHDKLKTIFSTLHHMLVNNFEAMNERLPSEDREPHFWADESRILIKAISTVRRMKRALNNNKTRYSFKIDEYYDDVMKAASNFLSRSGGSTIPKHMDKVIIYRLIPIFLPTETISLHSSDTKINSSKKMIGGGSYADVYKYYDPFYNQTYAVKTAKKELTEKELERFKIEFNHLKNTFNSPYIIKVYKYRKKENEYIMEYMDMNLKDYMTKYNSNMTFSERIGICRQILRGISHIHSKGLFHRDLSPKNILLNIFDDTVVVKIADLGLVKDLKNEMTRSKTAIKGYFNDTSDLARVGFDKYDIEHEVYALTRIVAFVLTGKSNIAKIKDEHIKEFVDQGTSSDKNKRFKSAKEMEIEINKLAYYLIND